jgi:hypothetical protein
MLTVDVEKIDRAFVEARQRFVKGKANKFGKSPISRLNKTKQVLEDSVIVEPSLLVAFPGIDRETPSNDAASLHCFAE